METLRLRREVEDTGTKVIRTENPLFTYLSPSLLSRRRFGEIVNDTISSLGGIEISTPLERPVRVKGGIAIMREVTMPYRGIDRVKMKSVRNLLRSFHGESSFIEQAHFYLPSDTTAFKEMKHRVKHPQLFYFMSVPGLMNTHEPHPKDAEGIFFIGQVEQSFAQTARALRQGRRDGSMPLNGQLEIHDINNSTEMMLAYKTVMLSLIMVGKMDISTKEKMDVMLPQRRGIFMDLYTAMLGDMMPPVTEDQLIGLDLQKADVNRHLYTPVAAGKGVPMNTALVGAPGIGKSYLARYFAFRKDVLTVPISAFQLHPGSRGFFLEDMILPTMAVVEDMLDIPGVLLVDDMEALFEQQLHAQHTTITDRVIDPATRSRMLSLLERMSDTYGIFLLGTLNYPSVETAFLRRLNLVYFPLPDDQQREYMIKKILPSAQLSDVNYDRIVEQIVANTNGFNYSGLADMKDYLTNFLLAQGLEFTTVNADTYQQLVELAMEKAKQREDVEGLKAIDEDAKMMVEHRLRGETRFQRRNSVSGNA